MELVGLLAHGGHPAYDHPAMAAIMVLALLIPWTVLFLVGRWFIRQRDDEEKGDR
jgi:membrane protein DedA with SNARE-associated domain